MFLMVWFSGPMIGFSKKNWRRLLIFLIKLSGKASRLSNVVRTQHNISMHHNKNDGDQDPEHFDHHRQHHDRHDRHRIIWRSSSPPSSSTQSIPSVSSLSASPRVTTKRNIQPVRNEKQISASELTYVSGARAGGFREHENYRVVAIACPPSSSSSLSSISTAATPTAASTATRTAASSTMASTTTARVRQRHAWHLHVHGRRITPVDDLGFHRINT